MIHDPTMIDYTKVCHTGIVALLRRHRWNPVCKYVCQNKISLSVLSRIKSHTVHNYPQDTQFNVLVDYEMLVVMAIIKLPVPILSFPRQGNRWSKDL